LSRLRTKATHSSLDMMSQTPSHLG
jgi:hypothetical protein